VSFGDIFNERPTVQGIEIGADANSLDFLQAVYRNPSLPLSTRMRAAGLALPHEVPKLSVAATVSSPKDYAAILDARIERAKELGLLYYLGQR
jgi:hypothetical protein